MPLLWGVFSGQTKSKMVLSIMPLNGGGSPQGNEMNLLLAILTVFFGQTSTTTPVVATPTQPAPIIAPADPTPAPTAAPTPTPDALPYVHTPANGDDYQQPAPFAPGGYNPDTVSTVNNPNCPRSDVTTQELTDGSTVTACAVNG